MWSEDGTTCTSNRRTSMLPVLKLPNKKMEFSTNPIFLSLPLHKKWDVFRGCTNLQGSFLSIARNWLGCIVTYLFSYHSISSQAQVKRFPSCRLIFSVIGCSDWICCSLKDICLGHSWKSLEGDTCRSRGWRCAVVIGIGCTSPSFCDGPTDGKGQKAGFDGYAVAAVY